MEMRHKNHHEIDPDSCPPVPPTENKLECRAERQVMTSNAERIQALIDRIRAGAKVSTDQDLADYARQLMLLGADEELPAEDDPSIIHQLYRIVRASKSQRNRMKAASIILQLVSVAKPQAAAVNINISGNDLAAAQALLDRAFARPQIAPPPQPICINQGDITPVIDAECVLKAKTETN